MDGALQGPPKKEVSEDILRWWILVNPSPFIQDPGFHFPNFAVSSDLFLKRRTLGF